MRHSVDESGGALALLSRHSETQNNLFLKLEKSVKKSVQQPRCARSRLFGTMVAIYFPERLQ
jgi:hypothetical protein